jgi:hypothetical protein
LQNYYFPKNICNVTELIAEDEPVTKKAVANKLMEEGPRPYVAGLLAANTSTTASTYRRT